MRKLLGVALILAGIAAVGLGLYLALGSFAAMYQGNLSDPLHQPEGVEKDTAGRMLQGVYVGAPGAIALIIGKVLLLKPRRRA